MAKILEVGYTLKYALDKIKIGEEPVLTVKLIAKYLQKIYYPQREIREIEKTIHPYITGRRGKKFFSGLGIKNVFFRVTRGRRIEISIVDTIVVDDDVVSLSGEIARISGDTLSIIVNDILNHSILRLALDLDRYLILHKIEVLRSRSSELNSSITATRNIREYIEHNIEFFKTITKKSRYISGMAYSGYRWTINLRELINEPKREFVRTLIDNLILRIIENPPPTKISEGRDVEFGLTPITALAVMVLLIFRGSFLENISKIRFYSEFLEKEYSEFNIRGIIRRINEVIFLAEKFVVMDSNSDTEKLIYAYSIADLSPVSTLDLSDPGYFLWLYALTYDLPLHFIYLHIPGDLDFEMLVNAIRLNIKVGNLIETIEELLSEARVRSASHRKIILENISLARTVLSTRVIVLFAVLFSLGKVDDGLIRESSKIISSDELNLIMDLVSRGDKERLKKYLRKRIGALTKVYGRIVDHSEFDLATGLLGGI